MDELWTVQKRVRGQSVFHEVYERWLWTHSNRKPNTFIGIWAATILTDDSTVLLRASVEQKDLPLAEGITAIISNRNGCRLQTVCFKRNVFKDKRPKVQGIQPSRWSAENQSKNVSGNSKSNGWTMGVNWVDGKKEQSCKTCSRCDEDFCYAKWKPLADVEDGQDCECWKDWLTCDLNEPSTERKVVTN